MKTLILVLTALIFSLSVNATEHRQSCDEVAKLKTIDNVRQNFHDKSQKVADAIAKAIDKMNEDITKKKEACGLNGNKAKTDTKTNRQPASLAAPVVTK